ncbi:retron St85 family RNA-directed DNA polymerase [Advenella sp. WQ 585]|uniref:RNA-directed DNA polymerase n=1 Tax=Advenella mandrilli TaxID=2800330 RepID=A0ABS1ECE3_9BURK|nr:retron St85 family RNA-directed DNA polymerase [Advenella mandrilli]MBK1781591.1 retron St85 family RNA-directed DNA polymerase [Advenella mandrilli]
MKTESTANIYRLKNLGLPPLATIEDIANATRLSPEYIKYLAFRTNFLYKTFTIPKRSGGNRKIANPSRALKGIQGWILRNILDKLSSSEFSMGFEKGTSILDNALPHTGSTFILTIDLEDFFPSITGEKIFGVFNSIGYSRSISHILANLCLFEGRLPQGAPTSPKLANLVCSRLDSRINGYTGPKGIVYTRYADDITLSSQSLNKLYKAYNFIPFILQDEGFSLNPNKTIFSGTRKKKSVTSLIISGDTVGIGREKYREIRSKFHKEFTGITTNKEHLHGWISFINSVDRKSSIKLKNYIACLIEKYPDSEASKNFLKITEKNKTQ